MFAKVFRSMYDGTLASEGPWEALVTFQQLLILADRHGIVDMTAQAIARYTTIPIGIISKGIEVLEQPDLGSRSPAENGCRIKRLEDERGWGWRIVNYEKYRNMRSEDDRREYQRQWVAERRRNGNAVDSRQLSTMSTHAEAEADSSTSPQGPPSPPVEISYPEQPLQRLAARRSSSESIGCRLPEDFQVTEDLREWARRLDARLDVDLLTAEFVDYWRSVPGPKGRKLDWSATWRNWIRRQHLRATPPKRATRFEEVTARLKGGEPL